MPIERCPLVCPLFCGFCVHMRAVEDCAWGTMSGTLLPSLPHTVPFWKCSLHVHVCVQMSIFFPWVLMQSHAWTPLYLASSPVGVLEIWTSVCRAVPCPVVAAHVFLWGCCGMLEVTCCYSKQRPPFAHLWTHIWGSSQDYWVTGRVCFLFRQLLANCPPEKWQMPVFPYPQ